jgi:hypothetical protein
MRELSSEAIDGVLDRARAASYLAHLESCPPCRVFDAQLREAIAMLTELPEVDAREGFEDAVWSRIARESSAAERGLHRSLLGRMLAPWKRLAPDMGRGVGWSFAGVGAFVLVLALVSGDPAPRSSVARVTAEPANEIAADVATRSTAQQSASETASSSAGEDEFVAEMPEAVREYLQNAKELRLPNGAEHYRRSNYSYPVRRLDDPSMFLTGESPSPMGPLAPAASEEATVISF